MLPLLLSCQLIPYTIYDFSCDGLHCYAIIIVLFYQHFPKFKSCLAFYFLLLQLRDKLFRKKSTASKKALKAFFDAVLLFLNNLFIFKQSKAEMLKNYPKCSHIRAYLLTFFMSHTSSQFGSEMIQCIVKRRRMWTAQLVFVRLLNIFFSENVLIGIGICFCLF